MRCQGCGRLMAGGAARCSGCGDPLRPTASMETTRRQQPILSTEWRTSPPVVSEIHPPAADRFQGAQLPVARPREVRAVQSIAPAQASSHVRGRVILMEGPVIEPAAFDMTLMVCQFLWFGLLLILPLMMIFAVVSLLIVAPSLLLLLAIAWLLGLVSPSHLLQSLSVVFRMGQWGRVGGDAIPVRYLRLRNIENDRESVVRLAGHLRASNVLVDDLVEFQGRQRHGVFHVTRGCNLRTGARIQIRRIRSRLLLAVTVAVYGLVITAIVIAHGHQLGGAK